MHTRQQILACQITNSSSQTELVHFLTWAPKEEFYKLNLEQIDLLLLYTIYLSTHYDEDFGRDFHHACLILSRRREKLIEEIEGSGNPSTINDSAQQEGFFKKIFKKISSFFQSSPNIERETSQSITDNIQIPLID